MEKIILYHDKIGCPKCGRVILFNKDDSIRKHRESSRPKARPCKMDSETAVKTHLQSLRQAERAEAEARRLISIFEEMLKDQPDQKESLGRIIAKKKTEADSFKISSDNQEKILLSIGYEVRRGR